MKHLLKKWDEIVRDYEANVTHIYGREIFHRIFDVVSHSVLKFSFKGQLLTRGYIEGLIAGDTKCGKSEVSESMCRFLGISKPIVCEAATYAGVVGGVKDVGGKFSISWGALPRLDRRMGVLDEVTGLTVDQISQMSGMRSSGVASLIKIEAERAIARVRKLWLSNPRTDRNRRVNTYPFGVLVIPEIIGRAEDISRFDFATVAGAEEVPLAVLNAKIRPEIKHRYTSEAARAILFWAWTRTPEQVVWAAGVEDKVLDLATAHCERYSSQIPLVEPGEQRYRVARVCVALAARFHSTDRTGQQICVRKDHVDLAEWFFRECYDRAFCAYDTFSQQRFAAGQLLSEGDFDKLYLTLARYTNLDVIMDAIAYTDDYSRMLVVENMKSPGLLSELVSLKLMEHATDGKLQKTRRFIQFFKMLKDRQGKGLLPAQSAAKEEF